MNVLWILAVAGLTLFFGGRAYSRFLARRIGEDVSRPTPALSRADGRDYVATPTGVVFAHHFASIAGAGPIVGPVLAMIYGYLPALIWVVLGGLLIGAVHDYLATYMATREGGQSIATVVRRMLGKGPFVALTIMLIVMLALVCAMFLNLSAAALTSMLPVGRLKLQGGAGLFRIDPSGKVVIGGIASTSVILITAVAPLLGWLYVRKRVRTLYCSLLAIGICAVSIVAGLYFPVSMPQQVNLGFAQVSGVQFWMLLLSAYCMAAAGVPVWIFLQSRDFINVHILYMGMIGLVATLIVLGACGSGNPGQAAASAGDALPVFNPAEAARAVQVQEDAPGMIWPMLFITIACGAVSGFHSLCAGGTTCKQVNSERSARVIGYGGMLLESFLAVCVIAALMVGLGKSNYLSDVYPRFVGVQQKGNAVLAFASATGNVVHAAWGLPVAVGTIAGMVLLEGFLVTTLDTAVRLTRYLIEEVWRALFGRYDVFHEPVAVAEPQKWRSGQAAPAGADGLPAAPALADQQPPSTAPVPTAGAFRGLLKALRLYWVNSGLAVAVTLAFAFTGGAGALWKVFASSNQLLAGLGLGLATLWLMRQGRRAWFAAIPAVAMLITTLASLILLLMSYLAKPAANVPLLVADIVILTITGYLLLAAALELRAIRRRRAAACAAATHERAVTGVRSERN